MKKIFTILCSICVFASAYPQRVPKPGSVKKPAKIEKSDTNDLDAAAAELDAAIAAANGANSYTTGSIVNDAAFIFESLTNKNNHTAVKELLKNEYEISSQLELDQNEFLKSDLKFFFQPLKTDPAKSYAKGLFDNNKGLKFAAATNAIGGLDVTALADGFAKFIVKRTKQELSISFFKRFKDDLENNSDLKTVFPKTSALLIAIDTQIYNYSSYINNLREAFREDLKIIDENLPVLMRSHPEIFEDAKNIKLKVYLSSAFYITTSLKHKMHPGDIIDGYPVDIFNDTTGITYKEFENLKGSIQTIQLFSESLKETDAQKGTYWVSTEKIRNVVKDQKSLQIYIGLLLQKAKTKYDFIKFKNSESFYDKINTQANYQSFTKNYSSYKNFILSVGSKAEELNKIIADYSQTTSDSLKIEKYANYFKTTVQLLESCTDISNIEPLKKVKEIESLKKDTEQYFDTAYLVADLTTAINRKNYPQVINQVTVFYNEMINDPLKNAANEKTSQQLTKYGAFMANMITAKTSDQVAEAIESAALPVGSASIKRESSYNVSLNAYCGLFWGNEIIKDLDDNKPFKDWNTFGLTAPIGISISKGDYLFFIIPWKGWSSSVFLSVVDLGAVAAYRFNDNETEQVPTIQLKDIFSPGISLSMGIPKTPISVNFNTQVGPNLRKVTSDTNDYSNKLYTRYSISICVDIPLLNLYTKPKG